VKGVVFRDRGVGLQIATQRGDGFALLGQRDLSLPEFLAPRFVGVACRIQCEFSNIPLLIFVAVAIAPLLP
jgi:hypothetical protein